MLFNSYIFIFAFLPITFFVYRALSLHHKSEMALNWLILASLFFYGWWNPKYVPLILCSMLVNYFLAAAIHRAQVASAPARRRALLVTGISFNLALLGYFKYANFFVNSVVIATGANWHLDNVVLPLAISFFTFQQIAYLVDVATGETGKYNFRHYALFVTFFPQLIAGPIVHHREMLPQFMQKERRYLTDDVAIGLTIFFIGLFKKAVFADGIAAYGSPIFDRAADGEPISFFLAWGGALCYTFQLYFDFSGYSDMAIGSARLFGIKLPLNFNSPYKSTSISEFWRRWHMTLSRFLRDYVYVALGGNRNGRIARYRNLLTTMLLGGLWHGAGWTFVIWGGLHGIYLVINHFWRAVMTQLGLARLTEKRWYAVASWAVTFIGVVFGWVLFRAETFDAAQILLSGMLGLNGFAMPNGILARLGGFGETLQGVGVEALLGGGTHFVLMYAWILGLSIIAFIAPNTQQIMVRKAPAYEPARGATDDPYVAPIVQRAITFEFTPGWAIAGGIAACLGIFALTSISEFLYFQF